MYVVATMVDMNEHVISSTQEVTYHNLDIVDCAVASTILDDTGYSLYKVHGFEFHTFYR